MAELKAGARPRVIAAIPAYNEEKYIGTVVLKARQHAGEVIVVDDGSTDGTAEVARLAGASVVQHGRNRGYGASVQTLIAEARRRKPDVLVLLDADSQHNPDEIPRLIEPVLAGADLVIGSREHEKARIPRYRRLGQGVLSRFSRLLSGEKVADSECGFRAFSPEAIARLELRQKGMAVSAETIAAAAAIGLKVTQVPVSAIYTRDGSTLRPIRHGVGNLARIVSMISERRPLFFFGLAGLVLVVLGILAGLMVFNTLSATGEMATGTAIISALLLIVGVFCIFTGVILNALSKRKGGP